MLKITKGEPNKRENICVDVVSAKIDYVSNLVTEVAVAIFSSHKLAALNSKYIDADKTILRPMVGIINYEIIRFNMVKDEDRWDWVPISSDNAKVFDYLSDDLHQLIDATIIHFLDTYVGGFVPYVKDQVADNQGKHIFTTCWYDMLFN